VSFGKGEKQLSIWPRRSSWIVPLAWTIHVSLISSNSAADGEAAKPTLVAKIEAQGRAGEVQFSPDGKTLAVVDSHDGMDLMLWDVPKRKVRETIPAFSRCCGEFTFSPDSNEVVFLESSSVKVLDLTTHKSRTLYKHAEEVTALTVSHEYKLLATGVFDGRIVIWDFASGKELARLTCPGRINGQIRFSSDGKTLIVTAYGRSEIWFFDLERKVLRETIKGGTTALAVSPNNKTLARTVIPAGSNYLEGTSAKEVVLFDTNTGKVRDKYAVDSWYIFNLQYSPDGRVLFAGGGQPESPLGVGFIRPPGMVAAWDAATGKSLEQFKALPDHVVHMTVSPDGKLLAVGYGLTAGSLKHVAVWEVSSLRPPPPAK
jgi:WD40 repeat protein